MRYWPDWRFQIGDARLEVREYSRSIPETLILVSETHQATCNNHDAYCVEREDPDDFIPWRVDIGLPSHCLGQCLGKVFGPLKRLCCGECLAGDAASVWVPALGNGLSAIHLSPHEFADGDGVWRVCSQELTFTQARFAISK